MRGADHGAQVVRIFDTVDYYQQTCTGRGVVKGGIPLGGAIGDHPLVRDSRGRAIELFAGFKADGNFAGVT